MPVSADTIIALPLVWGRYLDARLCLVHRKFTDLHRTLNFPTSSHWIDARNGTLHMGIARLDLPQHVLAD